MALQVTLVKTPGNIALPQNHYVFDKRGGTFGRADNNTWVLPDPEKFLSSCHCEIIFLDNQYHLEDKSTNGTFVNGSFEPVGRGTRCLLRNGDYFEIGDYRFSIQLQHQSAASPFDLSPAPSGSASFFDDLPITDLQGQAPLDAPIFDQQQDPLALWDNRPKPQRSVFDQPESSPSRGGSLLDDYIGLGKPSSEPVFPTMDVGFNMDQAVSWPTAKSEPLIPDDWEDDLLAPVKQPSVKQFPPTLPDDDLLSPFTATPPVAPIASPFEVPKPAARIPLAERILGMETKLETPSAQRFPDTPVEPPPPPIAVLPVATTPMPPQAATTVRADNSASRVLIEALGLDVTRLSEADMVEINRITGQLMREIVDGMLGVLRSRASIKNEFRMNVTTIQPVENNPLKFSVGVDDALENLFIKKSNAYKKPVDAFREGFQEIAEHQLAMIAGIRQGFEAMMERFDPQQLEKSFSKQTKGSVIPAMQKAKFWNSYAEYYQGFTDNMETSFQHLFGSDFVSAYEDQLRRLAMSRKRGEPNE